jgi:hypothetical protein
VRLLGLDELPQALRGKRINGASPIDQSNGFENFDLLPSTSIDGDYGNPLDLIQSAIIYVVNYCEITAHWNV